MEKYLYSLVRGYRSSERYQFDREEGRRSSHEYENGKELIPRREIVMSIPAYKVISLANQVLFLTKSKDQESEKDRLRGTFPFLVNSITPVQNFIIVEK